MNSNYELALKRLRPGCRVFPDVAPKVRSQSTKLERAHGFFVFSERKIMLFFYFFGLLYTGAGADGKGHRGGGKRKRGSNPRGCSVRDPDGAHPRSFF